MSFQTEKVNRGKESANSNREDSKPSVSLLHADRQRGDMHDNQINGRIYPTAVHLVPIWTTSNHSQLATPKWRYLLSCESMEASYLVSNSSSVWSTAAAFSSLSGSRQLTSGKMRTFLTCITALSKVECACIKLGPARQVPSKDFLSVSAHVTTCPVRESTACWKSSGIPLSNTVSDCKHFWLCYTWLYMGGSRAEGKIIDCPALDQEMT